MECDDKLPLDLVWQDDGHLGEVALSALADGEVALLPDAAVVHAESCASCASALGAAALLSLRVGESLVAAKGEHAPLRAVSGEPVHQPAAGSVVAVVEVPLASPSASPSAAPAPARPASLASRPLPLVPVAAALAVAALAAVPRLWTLGADLGAFGRLLLFAVRMCRTLVETGALATRGSLSLLPWVSAALLVVFGLCVARAAQRRILPEQGEQG
ncbi:hypothetical protein [Chondromyces apiculatus]|uniref:Uncharacterized protein n=1 Tax=Chondromyces apiculatus DSM 436 TaxID=1192034 RepID=A0A017SZI7_9BACT|nr:hypothetical protein [Chondromyces apiculatus]EYF02167.1 Hypothetical protein CAP_7378 [Chondromyces apiculatus DSM 436]